MNVIFSNVLSQLIYFILVIYAIGFLISLINRLFYKLSGQHPAVIYATGVIGTPIHELSHALMCLVFFHHIDEVKLFQIDEESGVLGYVRHSYNPKNLYHQLGNYFIGIAPIVGGSAIIFIAARFLLPTTATHFDSYINVLTGMQGDGDFFIWLSGAIPVFGKVLGSIFAEMTSGFTAWIFLILCICIAMHMNLSGADIKGSLVGIPLLAILLLLVNLILGVVLPGVYAEFAAWLGAIGIYLMGALLLSLSLSLICMAVLLTVKGSSTGIGRLIRLKK